MLALLIIVPVVGIIVTFARFYPSGETSEAPKVVHDPNKDIDGLVKKYQDLELRSRKVLNPANRESDDFEARVRAMISEWDRWMGEWDRILAPIRSPDGSLPPEYQGYSRYKGQAGLMRLDLIKSGGF